MNPSNSTNFRNVNSNGDWNNNNATNTNYVFPDFLHLVSVAPSVKTEW